MEELFYECNCVGCKYSSGAAEGTIAQTDFTGEGKVFDR